MKERSHPEKRELQSGWEARCPSWCGIKGWHQTLFLWSDLCSLLFEDQSFKLSLLRMSPVKHSRFWFNIFQATLDSNETQPSKGIQVKAFHLWFPSTHFQLSCLLNFAFETLLFCQLPFDKHTQANFRIKLISIQIFRAMETNNLCKNTLTCVSWSRDPFTFTLGRSGQTWRKRKNKTFESITYRRDVSHARI